MNEIIEDFCKAWQTLDSTLIIKHLDKNFRYDSQWVFESLDYNGYVEYITGKFQTLKEHRCSISVEIVDDGGSKMLKLTQNEQICFYRIKISNGKVTKGDMCMF